MKSIFIFLISSCGYSNSPQQEEGGPVIFEDQIERIISVSVGAEQLEEYLPLLEGKKVGIIGNQSSLIGETHLVDSLLSMDVNVAKVFSPEHGFRGKADAGEHVSNEKDQKTGLPIVSLYGKNKKPTQEQLKGLDVVVFDIQDVGVRFYTYISTLHYVMEACAQANIPVIVLDRPNPNGHYVDGPVLDMKYKSFVGMHPVPIVYGMTIGEYGKMINGEGWLEGNLRCDYTVIPCGEYTHDMHYDLPVPPSPNLRSYSSIQLYPSLCLLEATTVSVGRGTDRPFEYYGHPEFPKSNFAFTPKSGPGSKNPKHNGKECNGYDLHMLENETAARIDLTYLINSRDILKGKTFIDRSKMFNLLAGNNVLIQQLKNGKSRQEIRASWQDELDAFKLIREKYLMYE
ncbi:MAG: exo-beta-N-acetylmuramidase NamZ domain-containing protein [Crocinitomicaceae bacterium]